MRPNKLEHLSLETLSNQVFQNLMARPEPAQLEHLSDTSFLGKLLVFPPNVRLHWKVIASYKHSSLFGHIVSDENKFYKNLKPDRRPTPGSSPTTARASKFRTWRSPFDCWTMLLDVLTSSLTRRLSKLECSLP